MTFTDPTGLFWNYVAGAAIGFATSAGVEVFSRVISGQSLSTAICNTLSDPVARANIASSTLTGALTTGVSAFATKGITVASKIAATNIAINSFGGALDSGAKDVAKNLIGTGKLPSTGELIGEMAKGGVTAAGFGLIGNGIVLSNTVTTSQISSVGIEVNTTLKTSAMAKISGFIAEVILPPAIDTYNKIKDLSDIDSQVQFDGNGNVSGL